MQDATPQLYPSVVANLFATGLHQVIFKDFIGGKPETVTMPVNAEDFADQGSIEAMVSRTKVLGSLGTLVGERFSLDFFRAVCRHSSNPFRLFGFESYEPNYGDCAVVAHGSIDGVRPVWDQLIVPNLTRLGISTDPGVVPRTPGAPDGGVLEQSTPIGTVADPAMALVFKFQNALRLLAYFYVVQPGGPPLPIVDSGVWKTEVAPLLANPLLSS